MVDVLRILILSFGILLILFGISIFTPLFSWVGKKFNSYSLTYLNYNQALSIRVTSILLGIVFFIFGIFLTIATAAILDIWTPTVNNNPSTSVSSKPETFPNPMVPAQNNSNIPIPTKQNTSISKYQLKCPPNVDGLNIRKQAGLNTEIITLIPCDAVGIQDTKKRFYKDGIEWFLVKYQQNTGWVVGKYLKQQPTSPKKTTFYSRLFAKKKTPI